MPYQDLEKNWETLRALISELPQHQHEALAVLSKRYIEQNLAVVNDVLVTSIEHLQQLNKVKTPNDIICTQARFSNELSKKLNLSAQRFLNASLGQIADYNEWLKAHCDLSTD